MSTPLRITFILPGVARPNGGYRVVYQYATGLARKGHRVTVIHCEQPEGDLVRIHSLRERLRSSARAWRYRAGPNWFDFPAGVSVREVARMSAEQVPPADVVIATGVQTAHLVASACIAQGAVGIYFIQGYEDWAGGREFLLGTWSLPLYRVAVASWLVAIGRNQGLDVSLVPNAIDIREFPPGPSAAERTVDLTAMVSDQAVKRTDLVQGLATALLRRRPELKIATFGTCPRPLGLPTEVDHLQSPTRSRLAQLYRTTKVYLCASDQEGWGLPAAEAMASGAAVVSTLNDGVQEYGKDVARFVPVGELAPMLDAVMALLSDVPEATRLGKLGVDRMRRYSADDAVNLFEAELLKAITQGRLPFGSEL